MIDLIPMFYGIPVAEIERDVKDGKFILKSQGNINSDVKAQTIVVYGNVTGPIEADQVVIINGKITGNIHANTVTKLESKEKKTCESCKYYTEEDCLPGLSRCEEKMAVFFKEDMKICDFYQEEKKNESCESCKYYQNKDNFFECKYLNIILPKTPKAMIPCEQYTREK